MDEHELIFDWNRHRKAGASIGRKFELLDETLRDGLQSPSAVDPPIEQKIEILHLMAEIGVSAASVGLPGAGQRAFEDALALVQEMGRSGLPLKPTAAARTTIKDIVPVVELQQRTGVPVEVYTFIGSSPIRMFTHEWTLDTLLKNIEEAVDFGVKEGLEVCLVTEDTTRSKPQVLDRVFRHGIAHGARRLCIADTCGYATPDGVKNLVAWTLALIQALGEEVKLDWHGHNDRGLAVANALYAVEFGCDRAHGTGLGVGERVGNAAMDQILVNLKLLDAWNANLGALTRYCEAVAKACGISIPFNYPIVGRDAFRTGTGVHVDAIIKAQRKGDHFLADRIYSSVPAGLIGREQQIEIGPLSGLSSVHFWLTAHGVAPEEGLVKAIYQRAKAANHCLSDMEIWSVVGHTERPDPGAVASRGEACGTT